MKKSIPSLSKSKNAVASNKQMIVVVVYASNARLQTDVPQRCRSGMKLMKGLASSVDSLAIATT